jgi:hypothetical protein
MKKRNKWIRIICLCLSTVLLLSLFLIGCNRYNRKENSSEENNTTEQTPEFTKDNIRRLSVINEGKTTFELIYNPADYKEDYLAWTVSVPYEKKVFVNTEKMSELFKEIDGIHLTKVVKEAGESKLEDLRNSSKSELVLDYVNENGKLNTSHFYFSGKAENGSYPVVEDNSKTFYQIPESLVNELLSINPYDYILKLAFINNIDYVREVEINTGSDNYLMSSKENGFYFNDSMVTEENFHNLFKELMSVLIQREIETSGTQTDNKNPIVTITYRFNKDNMEDQIIKFLPYDENYASIQVDDTKFFLVNLSDVTALVQIIKNYFK